MRLWSKDIIDVLPDMQLRGQWRECCLIAKALHDGNLNHLLVNKVKDYPKEHFYTYASLVFSELLKRGYRCDMMRFTNWFGDQEFADKKTIFDGWHNDRYLRQCLYNLQEKYDCGGIPAEQWARIVKKFPWIEEDGRWKD